VNLRQGDRVVVQTDDHFNGRFGVVQEIYAGVDGYYIVRLDSPDESSNAAFSRTELVPVINFKVRL